jgi:urea transport system ATP-binding protein
VSEQKRAPFRLPLNRVPHDSHTVLRTMLGRRGGDLSGGLVMRPRLLLLDEPTEGIQPSIIKDIGRAIAYLHGLGNIAIVLVEQHLDFAQELGDHFAVMDRGQVVYSSTRADMDEIALKRALAI